MPQLTNTARLHYNKNMDNGTIVALSTAPLKAGIAVIRVSGPDAAKITQKLIKRSSKTREGGLENGGVPEAGKINYCEIDTGTIRDNAVILYFRSPASYTGEDVAEIQCHGSMVIVDEILKFFVQNGARPAERGEFTKRAYLNGKSGLMEAEGIGDLINAETVLQARTAYSAAAGENGQRIEEIRQRLTTLIAGAEAAVDYPEEDLESVTAREIAKEAEEIIAQLRQAADGYKNMQIIRSGIKVVIAGPVNAGKSTLLNRLVGRDRAIVSDTPGTTRDYIEDSYEYNGIQFKVTDTAGLRRGGGKVEEEGIRRTRQLLKDCSLVLAIADNEKTFLEKLEGVRYIKVINKCELLRNEKEDNGKSGDNIEFSKFPNLEKNAKTVKISAKEGINIDILKREIYEATCGDFSVDDILLANARQYGAAVRAIEGLERAAENLHSVSMDCILEDLRGAYAELSSLRGIMGSDEIIDKIFSSFCVGK